ncbi:MAG: hypothetical protein WBI17_09325 [Clostridiaceae bacterium]
MAGTELSDLNAINCVIYSRFDSDKKMSKKQQTKGKDVLKV